MWHYNWTAEFADKNIGERVATDMVHDDVDCSTGYGYLAEMDIAQGYPFMYSLTNGSHSLKHADKLISFTHLSPTMEEMQARVARYGPGWNFVKWSRRPSSQQTPTNKTSEEELAHLVPTDEPLPPTFDQQRLISADSRMPLIGQPYSRDDTDGEGITVFVLYTGFDVSANFADWGLTQDDINGDWGEVSYTLPNNVALKVVPQEMWLPENMDDVAAENGVIVGHGTPFLIKTRNSFRDATGDFYTADTQVQAIDASLKWSTSSRIEGSRARPLPRVLSDLGVVYVLAAGNGGFDPNNPNGDLSYMADTIPISMAKADSNVIAVGGTDSLGRYWPRTSPEGDYCNCPVTIWAQATKVRCAGIGGIPVDVDGTSAAAPQVAGLAAYFLRLYPGSFQWDPNGAADQGYRHTKNLKDLMTGLAYRRVPMDQQLPPAGVQLPYPMPADIRVAYNGIHGQQPNCDAPPNPIHPKSDGAGHDSPVTVTDRGTLEREHTHDFKHILALEHVHELDFDREHAYDFKHILDLEHGHELDLDSEHAHNFKQVHDLDHDRKQPHDFKHILDLEHVRDLDLGREQAHDIKHILEVDHDHFVFYHLDFVHQVHFVHQVNFLRQVDFVQHLNHHHIPNLDQANTHTHPNDHCETDEASHSVSCACAWDSGCAANAPEPGECNNKCPSKEDARYCDTKADSLSYPYGNCECKSSDCKDPSACQDIYCPSGVDKTCQRNDVGWGGSGFCTCET
ncbi:Uu.00g128200.m01.CDS01 [Anthostomella pinea]|uniref:Uu.00g128200.m01.CDS01 n=1 Tax=Anthostomella pinea TaxID=933095 RepID=A0AAI8VJ02_9PEZI|nr:Uu.00g128200.m01.CDS01 [Anthostomella pinea]